ncbi:uncharacterized protein LMH87_008987 [Akanthomyces muscarius]|uniref:Efficient mitochondria targeting-associated protein 19 n=1 Tax=Akanthomyces muscarius TaxID=2231603 RepID=A0A9W8QJ36_AKAMU|nr:uncharacterized protein LMH87_008987 [Akanthomyces muscarius]KAJ4158463.1 hypothetical protein LMH87_008987 [Akanthomyces muscarius]
MAPTKPYRDYLYVFMVVMHLTAMIGVDFVPFYPASLVEPPSSPFRLLVAYRNWYIRTMSDPYYGMDAPGHFFDFLVYIELVVQFPLALYMISGGLWETTLSGTVELAGALYGIVTGLCTALVCHDMWHLGPDTIDASAKQTLLYGAYLPFAIFPTLMSLDMCLRLMPRLRTAHKSKMQ